MIDLDTNRWVIKHLLIIHYNYYYFFLCLVLLRDVVQQLPPPNYRTLEYLSRHLYRVSLRGNDTGMTAKNVAIVWAPNLLRSKSIEIGGVAALQGSE